MTKIGLIVDEGADLPKEIIEKKFAGLIEVVPLKMEWPEVENLPGENIFQKMREAEKRGIKGFGKTSQSSPKDFLDVFKKQLEKFEELICITVTSVHSGTYNSACQAKKFLDFNPPTTQQGEKVFILDSLNASAGQGLLVLKAIDLIKKGTKTTKEIFDDLVDFRSKIHLSAMLKDPKWLEASGRISHFLADWVRKMEKIGIRPLLGIKKGKIKAVGIKKGAKDIPTALFQDFKSKTEKLLNQNKKIRVAITHGDNLKGAQRVKEMIEKNLKNTEVAFVGLIDNVLGVLVGPDALILAWSEY